MANDQTKAEQRDAERLAAMATEWDRARRGVDSSMPIWDALCEAIGNDANGTGMRAAIDVACAEQRERLMAGTIKADQSARGDTDAIGRSKMVLELVDVYLRRPDRMNRQALRSVLLCEFGDLIAERDALAAKLAEAVDVDALRKICHELRTYNPQADPYRGEHVHKCWARMIESAIAKEHE